MNKAARGFSTHSLPENVIRLDLVHLTFIYMSNPERREQIHILFDLSLQHKIASHRKGHSDNDKQIRVNLI